MTTISLQVENGRSFGKGIKNAKRMGGTFDPMTKTWKVTRAAWDKAYASDIEGLSVVPANRSHEPSCGAYYDASSPCECHN